MTLRELKEQLRTSLNSIRVRMRLMFTRGTLTVVHVAPAGKMQTIQVTGLAGETSDNIEHAQNYGLSTSPMPGAEPFMNAILGQRGQLVAIAICDPRLEPTNRKPGEVDVWSVHGQIIKLRADGGMTINAPGNIDMTGENITINARQKLEFKAKVILGRATDLYQYGTNGFGYNMFQTYIDNYTIGQTPGTTFPISPPEVPE